MLIANSSIRSGACPEWGQVGRFIDQYDLMFPYHNSVLYNSEFFPSQEAAKARVDLFLHKLKKLIAFI